MKMTKPQAESKVYELTEKLISTKKDQKDVNSGYKETIKDIESEIKAIIEDYSVNGTGVANP
jgi:ribosomal protein L7Ae-like RNA K-turn-binding protein